MPARRRKLTILCWALIGLSVVSSLQGGGPRNVDGTGQPMRWDNTGPIVYNVDQGPLGTLTNAQAAALLAGAFARWAGIPNVSLSFSAGAQLPYDVNAAGLPATNPAHWAHFWRKDADGLSPVLFDSDGSITDSMFGVNARFSMLGAAAIDTPINLSGTIGEASVVINGAYHDGAGPPSSPVDSISDLAYSGIMVHEIGHAIGLDHSAANGELAGDFDPDNDRRVPTMYPRTVLDEEAIATPEADDEAAAIALYPGAGASSATWSLTGVIRKDGVPFQGAQVIARRQGDPLAHAYEALSGARYLPCNIGGDCYPCDPNNVCSPGNPAASGTYLIEGMAPGSYTVCVEQLDRTISIQNGTSIGPLGTPPIYPSAEECWDANESADPATDDPDAATLVTASAGDALARDIDADLFVVTDPYESNNTLATAASLPGLASGRETAGAILAAADVDFYKVPVTAGQTVLIDVEASEIGSSVDPYLVLYDAAGVRIAEQDDGQDPDSRMTTPDPAIVYKAAFTGLLRIGISSYSDTDQSGDGNTIGPYFLRVTVDADADGDGSPDRLDLCPADAQDDVDRDGLCASSDNCPTVYNPVQANADGDPLGDACDTGQPLSVSPSVVVNTRESDVAGAHFGLSVAGVGDTDLDGYGDVLMGAPDWSDANGMRGAVFFNFGTGSGRMSGVRFVASADNPPGAYGFSTAAAGDVNCDGFADFLIGDPVDKCFEVWIGGGSFQGPTQVGSCRDGGDAARVSFAYSLAGNVDVNGDGAPDVIAGDPNHPSTGSRRGRAYLFLGVPPASCDPNSAPDTTPAWTADGGQDSELFASSVARAGDVNGDGKEDVLVGAPGYSNGQSGEGRAALYLGSPGSPYLTPSSWSVESDQASAALGTSLAGGGDINNDGFDDFAVGSPLYDGAGTARGRVLVYYGSSTGPSATPLHLDGDENGAHFGSSLWLLDVNGDGYADLAAGAPDQDAGGTDRGRVYVYLGSATGLSSVASRSIDGDQNNAHFGNALGGGDLGGDGRADLIVGAKDYDNGQTDEGRIYVFPGSNGSDLDGDGVVDGDDDCPTTYNPSQADTDTPAGADGICGNFDDGFFLYGPDNLCGTADDRPHDRVGDACASWPLVASFAASGLRSLSGAWGDYDDDGDEDLYLTGVSSGTVVTDKLFRNDGAGTFTQVTASPFGVAGYDYAAWADYNNDGKLDLLSIRDFASGGMRLLENLGSGSFTSIPLPALANPKWANWVDYDGDGDLDIYVPIGASGSRFFRNDGSDTFTLVTPSALGSTSQTRSAWSDFDGDGDLDVYVGSASCQLFLNFGSGTFTTFSTAAPHFCQSFDWGDYDNDTDPDLLAGWQIITNDVQNAQTGIVGALDVSLVVVRWADVDNDGDLDVIRGPIHRNDGNNVFQRLDEATTRSYTTANLAAADYDNDGRLDLLLPSNLTNLIRVRIVHNQIVNTNHWLEVDLKGTVSNRSGVGARVRAVAAGVTRTREVVADSVSAPLRLHFGLGDAREVERLEVRWPSGTLQTLTNVSVDRRITVTEADGTSPSVIAVFPRDGAVDVSTYANVVLQMNEAIDAATTDLRSVSVSRNGVKVSGSVRVSPDRRVITFDPTAPLDPDSDYVVQLTSGVTDLFGNPASSFSAVFDTGTVTASAPLQVAAVGNQGPGSTLVGQNADDHSGFSAVALGDVNGDGRSDLVIGAPNTDIGANVDAGIATLVFGQAGLQSNLSSALSLSLTGEAASDFAGMVVASAGDINEDGREDFFIAAPKASSNGAFSGKVYLAYGNALLDDVAPATLSLGDLDSCATPPLCGKVFLGGTAGDMAGTSVAGVGDIDKDGHKDLLIGAPGGAGGRGKVYMIRGPLSGGGAISLDDVGVTVPGLVFVGENAQDHAGISVSGWDQFQGDGVDDLLVGAPGASATDELGFTKTNAGYVYAIHGGTPNLVPEPASPATIDLSRVASGLADQVRGVVFIGTSTDAEVGRSVTGKVDINGDGQPDIIMGARLQVWMIPGVDPKGTSGSSKMTTDPTLSPTGLVRSVGTSDAIQQFGATVFTPGTEGDVGFLNVGPAGDVNGDGIQDAILGAPEADLPGKPDAGKAYVVFGSPSLPSGEIHLSDVGTAVPGVVIQGAEAGDQLGSSVSGGFDLNADGFADVVVGAPFADSLPSSPADSGETYVISLLPAAEVISVTAQETAPAGSVFLEWQTGDRAVSYNVYRALASALRPLGRVKTSSMIQLACAVDADADSDGRPDLVDMQTPPVGNAFLYLVTGRNLFGEGSLGDPEGAAVRLNDAQCP